MKKFAAIVTGVMLLASTAVSTVSAASVLPTDKTTGTLTLEKYESNTETEKSVPVSGAEFTAYQVIDLSGGTYKATVNFETVSGLANLLGKDEYTQGEGGLTYNSTEEFEKLIPALQEQSEKVTDSATDGHVYTSTESEQNKGTYTFGDMAIGVYLVVETKIPEGYTAASSSFLVSIPEWDQEANNGVGEWNYDVTAYPKNSPVTVDKSIKDGDKKLTQDTKSIGDKVPYIVETKLPDYGGANALTPEQIASVEYYFTDTMSKGLTFNDDMVVKVEGINGALTKGTKTVNEQTGEITWSTGADYALEYSTDATTGITTIKVDFNWASLNDHQNKQITLEYSATLNEDAVVGPIGNTNEVKLTFTNDPATGSKVTPPGDKTEVYTYGMNLTKTFNDTSAEEAKVDASAVEFSLSADGEKLWFVKMADGTYLTYSKALADDPDTTPEPAEGGKVTIGGTEYTVTQKLNPTAKGELSVDGLDVGTYTLVEENSVEGYSKLASDVKIVVSEKAENGKITGEVVAVVGDTTLDTAEDNSGVFLFAVNNVSKQFNLPLTGDAGVFVFTILGGIAVAIALFILSHVCRKKSVVKK